MIFEKYLMPDLMLNHFYDVTPTIIKKYGVNTILSDIDNTLVTYDDPVPTDEVLEWIKILNENGITVAFVSNNDWDRVDKFCENLNAVHYAKAGKPSAKYLDFACKDLNKRKEECILLGDQLLTDCASAKKFGIKAIIVPPIKDKKNLFFRFKRLIEKPYVKKYRRRNINE